MYTSNLNYKRPLLVAGVLAWQAWRGSVSGSAAVAAHELHVESRLAGLVGLHMTVRTPLQLSTAAVLINLQWMDLAVQ